MQVNSWTRFGGEVQVELVDASNETRGAGPTPAIAGHGFEDCDPISGDHLSKTVSWNGDADLSAWAGKPIRMRFIMRRARLFSLWFN